MAGWNLFRQENANQFERFVSRRYLHPRGRTISVSVISWISLLGVTIGVMVLIVVMSVMNGFQSDLIRKVIGAYSHVILETAYSPKDFTKAYQVLKRIENIEGAAPAVPGQTLIRSENYGYGAMVKGIDPKFEMEVTDIKSNLVCGSLDRLAVTEEIVAPDSPADVSESVNVEDLFGEGRELPGIVLGKELAKKLFQDYLPENQVWTRPLEKEELPKILGLTVKVMSAYEEVTPFGGTRMRERKFELVGITDSGLFDFDDISGFISLDAARYLYDLRGGYRRIELKLKDPQKADETLKQARRALYDGIEIPFGGMTWKEFNRPLFSAIQIEKLVMFVILVMLILLAGFSVAATLIMTVMEKTREIGVMRALGATRRNVRNIFLRIGLMVGVIGSLTGGLLGTGICLFLKVYPLDLPGGGGVYYIEKLPAELRVLDIGTIVVVTLVVCVLAAAYPARVAAKLLPVEALRYE